MLKIADIRRVQIELTTRCNARCPMCMRNYRGMAFNSGYPVTELTLDNIKHILKPEFLNQLTRGIFFNGNLGDFSAARDGVEIVRYLVEQGTRVQINTNGSTHTPEWWAKLALPGVTIGFALDGLTQSTHSLYRQDTDFDRIIENARAFIQAGGRAIWRFIPFDHNRHEEQACKNLAKELGFDFFENIHEGRDQGPVFTRDGELSHWLGPEQNWPTDSKSMVENHITWFDHRTIKTAKDTPVLNMICQHKRLEEIYIAADGTVYPCCFLGFYPGQMTHPGNEQLIPLMKENNALEYDLEHCTNWFNSIEETWARNSIAEGRLYGCINSCNRV
jgi:MoaA/NifB/PqqE/SkfB family radical SAM enzyme